MWRVEFGKGSALLVTGEIREDARLQAVAMAWLATGRWLKALKVERA